MPWLSHVLRALLALSLAAHAAPARSAADARAGVAGTVRHYEAFRSHHVDARNIDIWLPPGYDAGTAERYPVIYMHDGQNLFDPALSYTGIDWGVDEAMTRLIAEGKVRPAIVVGIWNTPKRFAEYMPQDAVREDRVSMLDGVPPVPRADLRGNAYLAFLVEELKPFVDARYRTLRDRDDTFVMGSSMGGLISAYALAKYPKVFGAAGSLSTHWPAGDGVAVDWLGAHLPDPRTHRIYFDHGTATLDAGYAPFQQRMDAALRKAGYVQGRNWLSRTFEGAAHNEAAWRARLDLPLTFLLGAPAARLEVKAGR